MGSGRTILVTGAHGFIGKNLAVRLREIEGTAVTEFLRGDSAGRLAELVAQADAIIHLAGENRPQDPAAFMRTNADLTHKLCEAIKSSGKKIPLIFASSTQAEQDNPYGISKRAAEEAVERLAGDTSNPCAIYRLPGVFGKWCRPNYNSVVATFCHHIAQGLPIRIDDPHTTLRLVYIDDVADEFIRSLDTMKDGLARGSVAPDYAITLGALAKTLQGFRESRETLVTAAVGQGLLRALYATYISYLPPGNFSYDIPHYVDERGMFAEMVKTADAGQFSFFTAKPGVTRGQHYHHSKTEKFLVLRGEARFRFRHLITNETHEISVAAQKPQIVETIPGWVHEIANTGDDELIVMLWANEIFDRARPDTIPCKV